jgi:hypothetical protein
MSNFERQAKNNEDGRWMKHHRHPLLKIRSQRYLMLFIEGCPKAFKYSSHLIFRTLYDYPKWN